MIEKQKLIEIVGGANVSDDAATLDAYSKDMSFVNQTRPAYVVKAHSADEVKQLVAAANETLTPLVPVSSGSPHFRGDTVPEHRWRRGGRPERDEEDHLRRPAAPRGHGGAGRDLRRAHPGRREGRHPAQHAPAAQEHQERGRQSARAGTGGHARVSVGHLRPRGLPGGRLRQPATTSAPARLPVRAPSRSSGQWAACRRPPTGRT